MNLQKHPPDFPFEVTFITDRDKELRLRVNVRVRHDFYLVPFTGLLLHGSHTWLPTMLPSM